MIDKIKRKIFSYINPQTNFYKKIKVAEGKIRFGIFDYFSNEDALGPVQKDEAIFLFGLVKVLRPRLIVEFGFARGDSSGLFVAASGPATQVYSYDINPASENIAKKYFAAFPNFHFFNKSQTDFTAADIGNQKADLVFIDGAHDLALNQQTFRALYPSLAGNAKIIIHDTGLWNKKLMQQRHFDVLKNATHKWVNPERVAHQVDERIFVNWIVETYPEFTFINFDTADALRHGLAILSRHEKLLV